MVDERESFVIGSGLTIVGDIDATGVLRIEGSVRGRVFVRGTLDVAAGGVVEGFVQALDIDVHGRLSGVVRAAGEVRLYGDGQVQGDVEAPRVRFVKGDAASVPPPAVAPPATVGPPPPADLDAALPPAHAGQTPGVLPPWPPQGLPRVPPAWAPRSARPPASAEPAPPPAAPEPEDEGVPSLPSITGGQRQIVVKRR
jgi:hypothetical protein